MIKQRLKERSQAGEQGPHSEASCGCDVCVARRVTHGPQLREREDWREGRIGPLGQGILKLAEMAKKHSSEPFYALDDPLEAAVFSMLVELIKELDKLNEA